MFAPLLAAVVAIGVVAGPDTVAAAPEPPQPPTPFVHPADVHHPECVIEIQPGDSLSSIAGAMPDTAVSYEDLQNENGIADADHIESGDLLDICVGNQLDDVTGDTRSIGADASGDVVDEAVGAQQR